MMRSCMHSTFLCMQHERKQALRQQQRLCQPRWLMQPCIMMVTQFGKLAGVPSAAVCCTRI